MIKLFQICVGTHLINIAEMDIKIHCRALRYLVHTVIFFTIREEDKLDTFFIKK